MLVTYVALLNPTYSFPAIFFRKFMSCRNSNSTVTMVTSLPFTQVKPIQHKSVLNSCHLTN